MQRSAALSILLIAVAVYLFAQQRSPVPDHQPFEVRSVFPRETSPGQYQQIEPQEIQALANQGWELVSVTPFIYRNEEHNNGEMRGPRPIVTQVYPAYFFKRVKLSRY